MESSHWLFLGFEFSRANNNRAENGKEICVGLRHQYGFFRAQSLVSLERRETLSVTNQFLSFIDSRGWITSTLYSAV